ncbi:MAG: matrixin family metalloprotease [Chthoniobacterales bacterium]
MTRQFGRLAAMMLAAFGFLACSSAEAYVFFSTSNPHWMQPSLTFHLQFPPPAFPLTDGSLTYYRSFENALQLWNEQLGNFQFAWAEDGDPHNLGGGGTTEASMATNAYNYTFGNNTLAVTFVNYDGAQMQECDIVFNVNKWTFDSFFGLKGRAIDPNSLPIQDFHRIALHELGHALGLDHPDQNHDDVHYVAPRPPPPAIMNSTETKFDVLQDDDIAGVRSLYGTPANAPAPQGNGHVANISTRVQVGTDAHVMIGGFIVQNASKPVLVRALGPSLTASGVAGVLPDPVLELHDGNGANIATNNDWKDDPAQAQQISATGIAPPDDRESAIYATLTPGNYTAIVSGHNGTSGVGLVEVYDFAQSTGKLANISTRAVVGTDENVLIGGFIVTGPQWVRTLVRGIGPSLRSSIPDALGDPTLELHDANGGVIASNDDWQDTDTSTQLIIENTGIPPKDPKESAIYTSLQPGKFTAVVRGKNNSTGVGLVEVYDLGPVPGGGQ